MTSGPIGSLVEAAILGVRRLYPSGGEALEGTVMCCQLRLPPPHPAGIGEALLEQVRRAIEAHGGTVGGLGGDALSGSFLGPAHTLAAAAAAADLLAAVDTLRARGGVFRSVGAGVGLDLGSMKRAARLAALSEEGRVLVSERVARALEGRHRTFSLGGIHVLGRRAADRAALAAPSGGQALRTRLRAVDRDG